VKLEHIAIWTQDIERLASFYHTYFGATAGDKYTNAAKGFESRFLKFDAGTRLQIMCTTAFSPVKYEPGAQRMGFTHIALSVGSKRDVDNLTARLHRDGYPVLEGPRDTGDGYYESIVLDPDGNRLEVTA